ncbi:MAG: response regulator transcription factor [Verrucomicrobia bacterium]|nr:MAG: response regulator transcription factor [Verrucomicrobiota bacterium]
MKRPEPKSSAVRRILLVDDHPITRQGLVAMIGLEPDLQVCGEAESAGAALALLGRTKPDLILVDLSLPGRSGLDLIKDLAATHPGIPALVLSMHDEGLYAERSIRAGARGYLMKSAGGQAVMEAIRHVLSGKIYVSAAVGTRILESLGTRQQPGNGTPMAGLSDREFEVFQLIGEGVGTREIAGRLNLSVKTVEAHRAHLKEKLRVKDATGLVREAVRWVESQQGV